MCFLLSDESGRYGLEELFEPGFSMLLPVCQTQFICSYKCNFIETQAYSVVYILSMVACALQRQNWVVLTENIWPAKPKIFIRLCTEKKCYRFLDIWLFLLRACDLENRNNMWRGSCFLVISLVESTSIKGRKVVLCYFIWSYQKSKDVYFLRMW